MNHDVLAGGPLFLLPLTPLTAIERGPYIQFSPDAIQPGLLGARTGLDDLDEEEIEATYQLNFAPYLMVQKDLLVTMDGSLIPDRLTKGRHSHHVVD